MVSHDLKGQKPEHIGISWLTHSIDGTPSSDSKIRKPVTQTFAKPKSTKVKGLGGQPFSYSVADAGFIGGVDGEKYSVMIKFQPTAPNPLAEGDESIPEGFEIEWGSKIESSIRHSPLPSLPQNTLLSSDAESGIRHLPLPSQSSSFLGPLVVGLIADATGNIRYAFFFLVFMIWLAVPVLMSVNVEDGRKDARAYHYG